MDSERSRLGILPTFLGVAPGKGMLDAFEHSRNSEKAITGFLGTWTWLLAAVSTCDAMKGLINTEGRQYGEMVFSLFHRELSIRKFQPHAVVHPRKLEKATASCLPTIYQTAKPMRGKPDVSPLDRSQRNKKEKQEMAPLIATHADLISCWRSGASIGAGFRER
ncbi:unnamed protein product [Cercospora beticola]|nr:unnamed protein product [Cercospora beticola]